MFHATLLNPPSQDALVSKLYEIASYAISKHFTYVTIQLESEKYEFYEPEDIADFADQFSYHNNVTVH